MNTRSLCLLFLTSIFSSIYSASAFCPPRALHSSTISLSATASSTTMTEVKVGDTIPAVEMKELKTGDDSPKTINLAELIAGKKVAIFGVPGAFTPGCSKSHLPSFMDAQGELKEKGVELTICVATNDAYTMEVSSGHSSKRKSRCSNNSLTDSLTYRLATGLGSHVRWIGCRDSLSGR